jgi:hypothetical protein
VKTGLLLQQAPVSVVLYYVWPVALLSALTLTLAGCAQLAEGIEHLCQTETRSPGQGNAWPGHEQVGNIYSSWPNTIAGWAFLHTGNAHVGNVISNWIYKTIPTIIMIITPAFVCLVLGTSVQYLTHCRGHQNMGCLLFLVLSELRLAQL